MRRVYSRILNIMGNVITVKARGVHYEELAEVATPYGKSLAQVIGLAGEVVSLQVFAGKSDIFKSIAP